MDFETYERERRADYAAFAAVVASILMAAIRADPQLRLQQVKDRAKAATSLKLKLEARSLAETTTLENDIKDLAGCRVIFYTNTDVSRFIRSGIMQENFDIIETKLHHPRRDAEDANELYISNHYLVKLRAERLALPEYARFADMRCEVQVQTILNHAWAEMAHDTIYKTPPLGGFGADALDAVKRRLAKVARKYLLPAGYEFQKIANDFQRLMEGKELFDEGALEAIVAAEDNNKRADALETFRENVLPYYDDIQNEYQPIVERLLEGARIARTTPPAAIETPYGELPAKTAADIIEEIAGVLETYRYVDVELTFDALCRLFADAESDDERKPLLKLGERMAQHNLHVWQSHGPAVQSILAERIGQLPAEDRHRLRPLLTDMLGEILGSDVTASTSSSRALTLHRGAVVVSDPLRTIRGKAIGLPKELMLLAESDVDKRSVLHALAEATRTPSATGYSNELARLVIDNTREIVEYETELAPTLSFEILQTLEDRVHHSYSRYRTLPDTMASDTQLVEARDRLLPVTLAFRDAINANRNFVIYKTLVGFESVFPPAWDNPSFDFREAATYREGQVNVLLGEVNDANADDWFAILSRCAQTQSDDAATFPTFASFLRRLGESKPDIVLGYIGRMEPPLARFLPPMLAGLTSSVRVHETTRLIDQWLGEGRFVADIAWYLRTADPFDEALLRRVLDSAVAHEDVDAVRSTLRASTMQFEANPGTLIYNVFLPALRFLASKKDLSWVEMSWFTWMGSPILRSLNEEQAVVVLDALVPYPDLTHSAEHIAAAIAARWPAKVVDFLEHRQEYANREDHEERYRDLPFDVHDLQAPLAAAQEILVTAARRWFATDDRFFRFKGGQLLAAVFPDLPDGFRDRLAVYVASGGRDDMEFVLAILSNYEGSAVTHVLVRDIVAQLAADDELMGDVDMVLSSTGVISGEFGWIDRYEEQKQEMQPWLADPRERVRQFAESYIANLDRRIVAEQRSAEASVAMRRLDYNEELDGQPNGTV